MGKIMINRPVDDRVGVIGGSDIAALPGIELSRWSTPYDLYKRYTGKERQEIDHDKEMMFLYGHLMEEVAHKMAERKYGVAMRRCNVAWADEDMPYLICHPDRRLVGDNSIYAEIKAPRYLDTSLWGEEDSDKTPDDYMLQGQSYFLCCPKCEEVWFLVVAGGKLHRYIVKPEERLMEAIRVAAKDFHDRVEDGWIPDPSTPAEANERWRAPVDQVVEADSHILAVVHDWREAKAEAKALKVRQDGLETQIKNYLGDCIYLSDGGTKPIVTWKPQSSTRFDSVAFRADHPDIYAEYARTTQSRVLR